MINETELMQAVQNWRGYKGDLESARKMQAAGMLVPNTRMDSFVETINANSRRAIAALEITDPQELEALGELLLNASRGMVTGTL